MPRQTPKAARVAARLTDSGKSLLVATAEKLGVSESAIIEMAIREYAEKRGIVGTARLPSGASIIHENTTDKSE